MKFTADIEQSGRTTTGIVVPEAIVEALGAGRRPPVESHHQRHTCTARAWRRWAAAILLGVSAEVRSKAGVAGGDRVEVDLEVDTEPRDVAVPPDLRTALDQNAAAAAFFDGLAYSHRLRHVLSIEDAKTPETRQRRIAKAVEMLAAGKK